MTSGERLASPSIDADYVQLTATLPAPLQAVAAGLPHRLGLTADRDGGWGEFVALAPNRDLPAFAAGCEAVPPTRRLPAERLRRYQRAHHYGGFSWLLRDRIADGQIAADPDASREGELLRELAAVFHQRWQQALCEASEDVAATDDGVAEATRLWRRGTRGERLGLRRGVMSPGTYAALVRDKLRWIVLPSFQLIAATAGPEAARSFRGAHDLFLLGLQAIDDVNDGLEDLVLYGSAVPTAIGCSPGALLRVAPLLVARAAEVASDARFPEFSAWLSHFAGAIDGWRAGAAATVQDDRRQQQDAALLAQALVAPR